MRASGQATGAPTVIGLIAAALFAGALATACGMGIGIERDPTMKAVLAPVEAAEIAALPDGPGKQIVAERCLLCHGAALVTQQRKDSAAWGRTVTQMRTWGTPIQDDDQAALVAYLTQHFGPASAKR
jgi:cytochrome c5